MTTTNVPAVIQLGREELAELLTPVNETLATDVAYLHLNKRHKGITRQQVWNIQREARYSGLTVR